MLIQELPCLDSNIAGQLLLIEFCNKIGPSRLASGIHVRNVPIMLQNSLKGLMSSDSVMLMRIGGACDDGAEQPGPGAAILFIQS
jgi:hypothetical protein